MTSLENENEPDYSLEIIDLRDYIGKSLDAMIRVKGRVIGKDGKSRRIIEELTECHISVFGKTISIIGLPETASNARKAIESLLRGSTHANVYKFLEKKRRDMKRNSMTNF